MKITPDTMDSLGINPRDEGKWLFDLYPSGWHFRWNENFPHLSSMSLMVDPGGVESREEGALRLYEAHETVVLELRLTPSQIERSAAMRLNQMAALDEPGPDDPPDRFSYSPEVEFSVMCWKRPKKSTA